MKELKYQKVVKYMVCECGNKLYPMFSHIIKCDICGAEYANPNYRAEDKDGNKAH